jgi:hypothetical protein
VAAAERGDKLGFADALEEGFKVEGAGGRGAGAV